MKHDQPAARRYYIGVGVFLILLTIAGFGPSLVDPSHRNGPPTALVIAHGATAALFLFLFLAQAVLIARGQKTVHRRLGFAGMILAFAVVVLGVIASIENQRRGYDLSGDLTRPGDGTPFVPAVIPAPIIFPLMIFFLFGILAGAAIWYRHRPEVHKRLMLFAVCAALGGEPIQHLLGYLTIYWPGLAGAITPVTLAVVFTFYVVNAIHDRVTQGRIHPLSLWLPAGVFASFTLTAIVMQSSAWVRVSEWLIVGK